MCNEICHASVRKAENAVQHWELAYQLRVFKAKGNTRSFLPRTVFLSGHCRSRLCNACSVQTLCICAVDKLWMCCIYCAGANQVLRTCQAGLALPRNVTFTVCPWQSFSVDAHAPSLRCSDMQQDWSYCHCRDQAARCPKVSLNLREKGLLWKSLGTGCFHPQSPSLSATCCLFLPSRSKLPSWGLNPPLKDSSAP